MDAVDAVPRPKLADRQPEVIIGVAGDALQASPPPGCDVDVSAFVDELGQFRHLNSLLFVAGLNIVIRECRHLRGGFLLQGGHAGP